MYGDDLRIQQFVEELDIFKEQVVQIEHEDDLVVLMENCVASCLDLLNDVCHIEKRIVN